MLSVPIYAQDTRPYRYQFTVVTENDAYTLKIYWSLLYEWINAALIKSGKYAKTIQKDC